MTHRTLRGEIRYLSDQPERVGAERGWESFTMTIHADGRRTLQARCEIDDAPAVLRHVSLSVDRNWHPQDATVRLDVGGQFVGSGWFRFGARGAECQSFTAQEGRVAQEFDLDQPVLALGSHPISGDPWVLSSYDLTAGPGKQHSTHYMLTSPDHRGATGPMLFPLGFSLVFIGEETISVPAGTFDAWHFQFTDTAEGGLPQEHPPYDVWCTADGNYVFLKGIVGGYMQTRYELVSLSEGRTL